MGSSSLKPNQTLYSPIELESLALRFALDKLDHYLRGCPHFTIVLDCKTLVESQNKSLDHFKNSKIQKMFLDLQELTYTMIHVQGNKNEAVDSLSRAPTGDLFEEGKDMERNCNTVFVSTINIEEAGDLDYLEDLELKAISDEINNDPVYLQMILAMKQGKAPKQLPKLHSARDWKGQWQVMSLLNKKLNSPILMDGSKIIVPKQLQISTVAKLHKDTHGYKEIMLETISQSLTWRGIKEYIEKVWDSCQVCKELQSSQPE